MHKHMKQGSKEKRDRLFPEVPSGRWWTNTETQEVLSEYQKTFLDCGGDLPLSQVAQRGRGVFRVRDEGSRYLPRLCQMYPFCISHINLFCYFVFCLLMNGDRSSEVLHISHLPCFASDFSKFVMTCLDRLLSPNSGKCVGQGSPREGPQGM